MIEKGYRKAHLILAFRSINIKGGVFLKDVLSYMIEKCNRKSRDSSSLNIKDGVFLKIILNYMIEKAHRKSHLIQAFCSLNILGGVS